MFKPLLSKMCINFQANEIITQTSHLKLGGGGGNPFANVPGTGDPLKTKMLQPHVVLIETNGSECNNENK